MKHMQVHNFRSSLTTVTIFSQSGLYLAKYVSHPTLTSISWQPLNISDTPAITICARPGYHPTKWAEYFATNFNGEEVIDGPDVSSRNIRNFHDKNNGSFVDFFNKVAIPIVTQVTYCALGSTDIDCDPYPKRSTSIYSQPNCLESK